VKDLKAQGERNAPPMATPASGESGSLFSGKPLRPRGTPARSKSAPELAAARMLCRQLPRKRVLAEKRRLAHLICLNLLAILKRRSQQV